MTPAEVSEKLREALDAAGYVCDQGCAFDNEAFVSFQRELSARGLAVVECKPAAHVDGDMLEKAGKDNTSLRETVATIIQKDDLVTVRNGPLEWYEPLADRILAAVREVVKVGRAAELTQVLFIRNQVRELAAERDELRGMLEIAAPEYAGIRKERDEALRVIDRLTSDISVQDAAQRRLNMMMDAVPDEVVKNVSLSAQRVVDAALAAAREPAPGPTAAKAVSDAVLRDTLQAMEPPSAKTGGKG